MQVLQKGMIMRKLARCNAPFDCTECVNYDLCKRKARIRRLKKRARLAVFYLLCPFVYILDFILKVFSKKSTAVVAIFAIVFALGLSGFTSIGGTTDMEVVMAMDSETLESSEIPMESIWEPIQTDEISSPRVEESQEAPVTETIVKAQAIAVEVVVDEVNRLIQEEAAAQAEAERLAKLEAENQIHDNIFVHSQEIADQMGLLPDYDPILAMYGMRYLTLEEGFTIEGAAGLIGNVYSECKFVLDADNGSHFGIFQWDYSDRWPRISEYLEENGVSHYSRFQDFSGLSLEEECELFVWQLRAALHSSDAGYYSNTIENCRIDTSASSSADRWRANYEVCSGAKEQRMEYAEYTATLYHELFD